MAASTAGSVKAFIESLGLGVAAYRDGAPTTDTGAVKAATPYVVVQEGIGYDASLAGDFGDHTQVHTVTELVQVDLYQSARALASAGGSVNTEDYLLPGRLQAALNGARLGPVGLQRVHGCAVRGGRRWPIRDNIVRHTVDLQVTRELDRST